MKRLWPLLLPCIALLAACARGPVSGGDLRRGEAHDRRERQADELGALLVGEFATGDAGAAAFGAPATLRIVRLPEFGRGFYAESWCMDLPDQTFFQEVLIPVVEDEAIALQRWRLPRAGMYVHVWENEELLNRTGMYDIRRREGCAFGVSYDADAQAYRAVLDCSTCPPEPADDGPAVLYVSRQGISLETCGGLRADFERLTPVDESLPTP